MKRPDAKASKVVNLLLLTLILSIVASIGVFRSAYTQSGNERKANVHAFTRMPLAVKEIRNLQKEGNFLRDLEIEVKNVSRSPIYFISVLIEFPDMPAPRPTPRPDNGFVPAATTGFTVTYGAERLMDTTQLAGPDDVPLKPGETYVFKIPEARVVGFEYMNREMNLTPQAWKRIEVSFNVISLGDGTGYEGGRRMLHSKKRVMAEVCKPPIGAAIFQNASWSKHSVAALGLQTSGCVSGCDRYYIESDANTASCADSQRLPTFVPDRWQQSEPVNTAISIRRCLSRVARGSRADRIR